MYNLKPLLICKDCTQVVAPIFRFLAVEIDKKGGAKIEISRRIGYDDANECFCRKDVVKCASVRASAFGNN